MPLTHSQFRTQRCNICTRALVRENVSRAALRVFMCACAWFEPSTVTPPHIPHCPPWPLPAGGSQKINCDKGHIKTSSRVNSDWATVPFRMLGDLAPALVRIPGRAVPQSMTSSRRARFVQATQAGANSMSDPERRACAEQPLKAY